MFYQLYFTAITATGLEVNTDWLFQLDGSAIYGISQEYSLPCSSYTITPSYVYYDTQAFSQNNLLMTFDLPVYNTTNMTELLFMNRFERCPFPVTTSSQTTTGTTTCDIGFDSEYRNIIYGYYTFETGSILNDFSFCRTSVNDRVLVYEPKVTSDQDSTTVADVDTVPVADQYSTTVANVDTVPVADQYSTTVANMNTVVSISTSMTQSSRSSSTTRNMTMQTPTQNSQSSTSMIIITSSTISTSGQETLHPRIAMFSVAVVLGLLAMF
jgi:hypothetical protein